MPRPCSPWLLGSNTGHGSPAATSGTLSAAPAPHSAHHTCVCVGTTCTTQLAPLCVCLGSTCITPCAPHVFLGSRGDRNRVCTAIADGFLLGWGGAATQASSWMAGVLVLCCHVCPGAAVLRGIQVSAWCVHARTPAAHPACVPCHCAEVLRPLCLVRHRVVHPQPGA